MDTASEITIVTTPSFGAFSPDPWDAARQEGLDLRRSAVAGPLSSVQLAAELTEAAAVIVGVDQLDRAAIESAPNLRVIGKHGVGVDNIDLAAAAERGITVVLTPGANTSAVADMTMALLLAGARQLLDADRSLRAGLWEKFSGPALEGRTLGLLGFGRIGQAVARRAAGFDCDIVAFDPLVPAEVFDRAGVGRLGWDEVISGSDFLSLHLPLLPGSGAALTAAEFARMKPGVGIVNTARGGLIEEAALIIALEEGTVGFAALDAFATEPLDANSALRRAPRSILTPHAAAFTDRANAQMGTMVVRDIARVLRGEAAQHPVQ